jgi:CheY-like chemotaxis protein
MIEWGTEAYVPNVRFISLPIQALSISDALNGAPDRRNYGETEFSGTRFIIPDARILVVDDIETNLKVTEGLIAPYNARVDVCLSGAEAVELVGLNRYDIVFMDHMMPKMDGVEAAALIREQEKERGETDGTRPVPIVALTANAVTGMRDMFIENGFNDFLAKPIDMSKLDEIIEKWIPKEKQIKPDGGPLYAPRDRGGHAGLDIPGVDVKRGIAMVGGTVEGYKQVLSVFRKDADDRLALLRKSPSESGLDDFVIQVHALKSALASIGAADISAEAARLEAAGKAGDMSFIGNALPVFVHHLTKLAAAIQTALTAGADERAAAEPTPCDDHYLLLRELTEALRKKNIRAIDALLEELNQKPLDATTREVLEQISDQVLMAEFEAALEITSALIEQPADA